MNLNKYVSINSSLVVIGLYSNVTIAISIFSMYHAVKLIKNSFFNLNITSLKKIYKKIVVKAWEDEDFKNELIANPLKTLNQFTKRELDLQTNKFSIYFS